MARPKAASSLAEKEMNRLEDDFKKFDNEVKELTLDRMRAAPKEESEQQTKLGSKDLEKSKDIYLKPKRSFSSKEKFNEKFRDDYNFAKEYVQFMAENKEVIGESIEIWTKKFPGVPAEEWVVPVNKPVWGPRYLAEQIKSCQYSRMSMQEKVTIPGQDMAYYGQMIVDSKVQRLDAIPVSSRKSVFMGAASGF